ncbi:uncharacterized protein ASPGLDRAFT_361387 [Aspergillus glaucus CBS 516.65]|uniref:Uncharacterized protein n=1 Tax=Aspergillus glaucus CBS 516.65 TaxID=1160497 RepID=A0A1L9VJ60_ASPGL|nr:hypothetical protein ASPGLDRAFT_361387 [Aspergillus glaucus CBS 516.65]OJJ83923.1 hypothetical protein ASPGLDRAFT_361387 [Aspergillus glaucus CBS 516.65]
MAGHSSYQQGLIPQIPGLHTDKLILSGGCLPICSIYDNMIWILYDMDTILYSCLLCASPSSFLFSLSLIVILPCMCRPSFGYVTTRLETQYSQHDSSIPVKGRPPCCDEISKRSETSKWLSWKLRLPGSLLEVLGEEDPIVWVHERPTLSPA